MKEGTESTSTLTTEPWFLKSARISSAVQSHGMFCATRRVLGPTCSTVSASGALAAAHAAKAPREQAGAAKETWKRRWGRGWHWQAGNPGRASRARGRAMAMAASSRRSGWPRYPSVTRARWVLSATAKYPSNQAKTLVHGHRPRKSLPVLPNV